MSGFYIGVDGKARKVKDGYIGIDGVARKIKKIYIGDENGKARMVYSSGKKLSEYTVGSTVYLLESGSPVEYIVVHQGLPSAMYDSSCDGVWLLRKNILNEVVWGTTSNSYKDSSAHKYLNGNMQYLFDETFLSNVKQVKIPYVNGTGSSGYVASGSNGLSAKFFLLSGYELGWTKSNSSSFPADGAKLDYFLSGNETDACNKRIAYYNGSAKDWYLRSAGTDDDSLVWIVPTIGLGNSRTPYSNARGLRPALILPYNINVDPNTNIVVG